MTHIGKWLWPFAMSFPLYASLPPGVQLDATEVVKSGPQTYTISEYKHRSPPKVILDKKVKLKSCVFHGKKCAGNEIILELQELVKDRTHLQLAYEFLGRSYDLQIRILPDDFPYPKMEGGSQSKSPLIFSASSPTLESKHGCHLVILSPHGRLLFHRRLPKACFDFRPHSIDGKTFYSYQLVREGASHLGTTGPRIVLDKNFNEIKSLAFENDGHEFHLYSIDHWLGIEIQLGRLKNGRTYVDKRIRERRNGKIVFDWGVSDYLKQFNSEATTSIALTNFRGEIVAEVLHLNSVQRVGENHLLIGLGYEGLGLLNRKTRKLDWVLGGLNDMFGLSMGQHPLFNHQPQFFPETGELYVLSNRSFGAIELTHSRVLRYKLDTKKMKVIAFNVYEKSQFSGYMGSIQYENGLMSVGYGEKFIAPYDFLELQGHKINWKIDLGGKLKVYRFYRAPFGE